MSNEIVSRIDKYSKEGSGWVLSKINSFNLQLFHYKLRDDSGVGTEVAVILPIKLQKTRTIINVKCKNDCFKGSTLIALHHYEVADHKERISNYVQWSNKYECKKCLEKFSFYSSLISHMKTHHKRH